MRLSLYALIGIGFLWYAKAQSEYEVVGLAFVGAGDSLCLSINHEKLYPGASIALIDSSQNGTLRLATIRGRRTENACPNTRGEPDYPTYELTLDSGSVRRPAIYFAVLGGSGRFRGNGSRLLAEFDRRMPVDEFEVCTSNEGVHFTIWNGPMSRGERIWHRYYYVGYDLEADCTEPEYQRP